MVLGMTNAGSLYAAYRKHLDTSIFNMTNDMTDIFNAGYITTPCPKIFRILFQTMGGGGGVEGGGGGGCHEH